MSFTIVGDEGWKTDFKVEVSNLLFQNEKIEQFDSLSSAILFMQDYLDNKFLKLLVKQDKAGLRLVQIRVIPDFENEGNLIIQRGHTQEGVREVSRIDFSKTIEELISTDTL